MSGKILNLGADWGVVDTQTGIFTADTRYNLQTDDGANLWLQTSGSSRPEGGLGLRIVIETGDKGLYWLNNAIGESCLGAFRDGVMMLMRGYSCGSLDAGGE